MDNRSFSLVFQRSDCTIRPTYIERALVGTSPAPSFKDNKLMLWGHVELFNRDDLQIHTKKSSESEEVSDAQLILELYEKYGEECLPLLNGEFAFVLFDFHASLLFGARDQLGIVPFYYSIHDDVVIFGDSISTVVNSGLRTCSLSAEYIFAYLQDLIPEQKRTCFSEVFALPPGHILRFSEDKLHVTRFFHLSEEVRQDPHTNYATRLRNLCTSSVVQRIEGKKSLGISLSGGLDSSSIACLMAEYYRKQGDSTNDLKAVSRVFKEEDIDPKRDEKKYAQLILEKTGIQGSFCDTEIENPLTELPFFYEARCNFPYNPFIAILTPMCREVELQSIKNLLVGFGGDEGPSMHGLNVRQKVGNIHSLRENFKIAYKFSEIYGVSVTTAIRVIVLSPWLPRTILKLYRLLIRPREATSDNLNFAVKCEDSLRVRQSGLYPTRDDRPTTIPQHIDYNILKGSLHHFFEGYRYLSDRYHFTFSFPLLDKDIISFCNSVPAEEYLLNGWKRSLFRRSMANLLPKEVCWRKGKSPFSKPYSGYIRNGAETIDSALSTENSTAWKYVDRVKLKSQFEKYCGKDAKEPFEKELIGLKIGRAINVVLFIQWLEKKGLLSE